MAAAQSPSFVGLLTLREIRAFIRQSHAVAMTVFLGIVYALGALVVGQMLILTHLPPPYYTEILWSAGPTQPVWSFPALIVWAPWGVVTLPFFATVTMVLVSIGVAIGMSSAILLTAHLIRRRRQHAGAPSAYGAAAGLTPAMLALVTLGACCGTTAAATAGIGAFGSLTGSSTDTLLVNNWLLGVFQIVVVWIALLAQEMLLQVYGELIGVRGATRGATGSAPAVQFHAPRYDRRFIVGIVLRAVLLVGGVAWALAMLSDWTVVAPLTASVGQWTAWLLEYEVVAILAVLAALFPVPVAGWFARQARRPIGLAVRAAALLGGLALAAGVPPPLATAGLEGFGNELLFVLGAPAAWGAVPPVFGVGLALYLRWGLEYLVLGGFATAVALGPGRALRPLASTVGTVVHRADESRAGAPAGNVAGRAGGTPSSDDWWAA